MGIDLSGLERFGKAIDKAKRESKNSPRNPKIARIIEIAKEELTKAYSGKLNVDIFAKQNRTGYTIYVKDKNSENPTIAFDEFGTGFYAKGSYLGKLPTQKITFKTVVGRTKGGNAIYGKKTTNGWDYYYPNEYTKTTHGGIKGWVTKDKTFHIGHNANSTMYKACKIIVARIRSELN